MDQADDNSLTALLTKNDQVRFGEIVNTCTERRAEKRIQRPAWRLSHVLRKTLCEHVNGLCPAGWLNEQSITKHWFQSVRTCPYSWATGRNNIPSFLKRGPAGARWIVCDNLCGVWQVVSINWARGRHSWACGTRWWCEADVIRAFWERIVCSPCARWGVVRAQFSWKRRIAVAPGPLPPTQPFVLMCTPTRSGSPDLSIHGNFVGESFMRVAELTLPTHAAELAQGTGGVHLWYDIER